MNFKRLVTNIVRYGKSPKSALLAAKTLCEYHIVKKSALVDKAWISSQYAIPDAPDCDPLLQYIVAAHTSSQTAPSPWFCDAEYRAIHKLSSSTLPIVHYELFGKKKGAVLSYLEQSNNNGKSFGVFSHQPYSFEKHIASFPRTINSIKEKIANGEKVRAVFLVFSSSMFPTRPLLDKLILESHFEPKIIVVPDLRWPDIDPHPAMQKCYNDLRKSYPEDLFVVVDCDKDGNWPDVVSSFDIVSYATPYDLSDFHYNPRWVIGRRILPIQANYTLSAQNYGRVLFALPNQALFWKIFFENTELLNEFKDCMLTKGHNCPITGYMKMDALNTKPRNNSSRKCIIIAPHHSIAGGYNDMLSMSNFLRYADFFKNLPLKYPEIDFVFRPHPFLIQALKQPAVWGVEKTNEYLANLLAPPNIKLSCEGDYMELFAKSDGIIQDCCSFLIEYFYTGKPQCYMLKSKAETDRKFLQLGKRCLEACYQAYSEEHIDAFINNVIMGGTDVLKQSRDEIRLRLMVNYPHATDAALGIIKQELGMDT